ncbi:hypothetical protein A5634_15370 [Mycobacterium asiaticum]|uniref:Integrase SAM-like N-terminal domain-containing protein n=1 Tax=Mycobacterium asiaticum TaxID=1790 RepID=A0A1A3P8W4_MYCAS|nr:hypothetical protein [Mycobacterium asiaticum]OBK30668.1 hypothetical protein A5634_15370 [Mycobacterium asiaticum]
MSNDPRRASIRERVRSNGELTFAVLFRVDGRQSSLSFKDRHQADGFRSPIKGHGAERALEMHCIDSSPRQTDGSGRMTVGRWIDRHIDSFSGFERKTRAECRRYLTRDIEPVLGNIPLAALSRSIFPGHSGRDQLQPSRPAANQTPGTGPSDRGRR